MTTTPTTNYVCREHHAPVDRRGHGCNQCANYTPVRRARPLNRQAADAAWAHYLERTATQ
jgi:hypothetical protein